MAKYTVPSQRGGQIPLQTEDREHLSALDVVWANRYEDETISPKNAKEMEFKFYKGAPAQWLNFYWAEQENSPFVKRDMYQVLQRKINETLTKRCSIACIDFFHEPGSGGSTLAMQVLWDLRKKLRCAKVLDSTTDPKATALQVLQLFSAAGPENRNTVLLLLDNKYTSDDASFRVNLEKNLWDEIKANNITATIPVVIILNCLRQTDMTDTRENVKLYARLSEKEKSEFEKKQSDVIQKHGDRPTQLYGFNIMLRNFDPSYVAEVCGILPPLKKNRRPCNQQLLEFLALINSYVPGSYLPQDLCQNFIENNSNNLDDFSLEQRMQPFTDFIVIFSTEARSEDKHVRMVHPMIAQKCLELLTQAGVKRSDTTLKLLRELCSNASPPCLVKTIKKLLTKRESRQKELDKFSKLILDTKTEKDGASLCIAVLKMASEIFTTDPFYPQALARFYYIEEKNYENAKHWAEMAIRRDERNSYIIDTLGQVLKNCLKNKHGEDAMNTLQVGKQATKAFEDEEKCSVSEEPEMQGTTSTSSTFNYRGKFGYMQVAKIIYEDLTKLNAEWSKVLTQEVTADSFLKSYENGKCWKYKSLITSLRDEVEKRFRFFEWYPLYSKPSIHKDEPSYLKRDVNECYSKFVSEFQKNKSEHQFLKEKKASTFAGLLNQDQSPELEVITEKWKVMYSRSQSDAQIIQNYIAAQVMLSQNNERSAALRPLEEMQEMVHSLWTKQKENRSPEFYLLVLLLFWPDAQQGRPNSLDISECVKYMHCSFERTYKKYLRSRFLTPLFFLSEGHGLQRFLHKSRLPEALIDLTKGNDIPQLKRVSGEVRDCELFAGQGSEKIKVSPNYPGSICGQGQVTFQLGFTIKGPVAYNIRYQN